MYLAHDHLEDVKQEARQGRAAAAALALSAVGTVEIARIHGQDQGQDQRRGERAIGGLRDVRGDLLHTTLPMTVEATSALIFSGVAMYMMIVG